MFIKLNNGHALCVEAYKDIQQKAIVPPVNELWSQVDEYVATNGWHEMTEQEIADFFKPEPTPESEHNWVKSELDAATVELMYHWTGDPRASHTEQAWKDYAIALRDYTSKDDDGNPVIVGNQRPSITDHI